MNAKYRPFVYLLIIYLCFETSGQFLIWQKKGEINSALMNVFVLIDFITLYLILNYWKNRKISNRSLIILSLMLILWLIDNIIIHRINNNNSLFRIIYSIVIVIKSIDIINKHISRLNFKLKLDPILIISFALLIQFTFKTIYETAFIFSLLVSNEVYLYSFSIHLIMDFIGYIIFTIAILCMRKSTMLTSSY